MATTQKVYTDEQTTVTVLYRNHRGLVEWRTIIPHCLMFGECGWHPGPQWLLHCKDLDKGDLRTFAVKDIIQWGPPS